MDGDLENLMATKIFSCLVDGLDAHLIEVEVDILQGLPGLSIVGLGDTAVQEAKERIRSSIKNSGVTYPQQKKIINLAPAHLRKNGACFDLPMALGLLEASKQINVPKRAIIVGELALNGEIRPIKGALSIAIFAQKQDIDLFLPASNAGEVSIINYSKIYPVHNLREFIGHCRGLKTLLPIRHANFPCIDEEQGVLPELDMNMIQGQQEAKRALEIAAAGGHHLLLYGPPGTGKTLLAQAFQTVLPRLSQNEMLEVMQIYSLAGLFQTQQIMIDRPFRKIHQSCTLPALVGGGNNAQPGEISLAHHGVLFFDEIAEAPRRLLEALRQPLEERKITVSRLNHHTLYPANFTLIAAMNPCPCGYYGDKKCTCSNSAIIQYHKKLSGPILDRIDLFIKLQREPIKIQGSPNERSSKDFRENIIKARQKQVQRFHKISITLNSQMKPLHISEFCQIETPTQKLVTEYANQAKISARGFHNILKLSRTIADLNDHPMIQKQDVMEAFTYRVQPTSPLI